MSEKKKKNIKHRVCFETRFHFADRAPKPVRNKSDREGREKKGRKPKLDKRDRGVREDRDRDRDRDSTDKTKIQ